MNARIWIERIAIAFALPFYLVVMALFGLMIMAQDIRKAPVRGETE